MGVLLPSPCVILAQRHHKVLLEQVQYLFLGPLAVAVHSHHRACLCSRLLAVAVLILHRAIRPRAPVHLHKSDLPLKATLKVFPSNTHHPDREALEAHLRLDNTRLLDAEVHRHSRLSHADSEH